MYMIRLKVCLLLLLLLLLLMLQGLPAEACRHPADPLPGCAAA
jgi:hypothetical protein